MSAVVRVENQRGYTGRRGEWGESSAEATVARAVDQYCRSRGVRDLHARIMIAHRHAACLPDFDYDVPTLIAAVDIAVDQHKEGTRHGSTRYASRGW